MSSGRGEGIPLVLRVCLIGLHVLCVFCRSRYKGISKYLLRCISGKITQFLYHPWGHPRFGNLHVRVERAAGHRALCHANPDYYHRYLCSPFSSFFSLQHLQCPFPLRVARKARVHRLFFFHLCLVSESLKAWGGQKCHYAWIMQERAAHSKRRLTARYNFFCPQAG